MHYALEFVHHTFMCPSPSISNKLYVYHIFPASIYVQQEFVDVLEITMNGSTLIPPISQNMHCKY